MQRTVRLATRKSPLALWQTRHAARLLRLAWPGLRTELVPVTSTGDRDTSTPLYGMGNIGVFAKEVHEAVLRGDADIAVHSCKDLPTTTTPALAPPVLLARHDVRDALIGARSIADLPTGATVGSSSLRRRSQLLAQRPDLRLVDIRGNVATRLEQVHSGAMQATVLAAAGLQRLGILRAVGAHPLHPVADMIPAVAQGAMAVDCRRDDVLTRRLIGPLAHRRTLAAVRIERTVLAGLRGGCSLPLGCYVRPGPRGWRLDACLDRAEGLRRVSLEGPAAGLAERCLAALQS